MRIASAHDTTLRVASLIGVTLVMAFLLAIALPASQARAASPSSSTCVGTAQYSQLKFSATTANNEWGSTVYRSGGAKTYAKRTWNQKTVTHTVDIYYCKAKGTTTWKLWSWHVKPVYSPGTVTLTNGKITNATGPLTLVKKVATGTFSGVSRQYLEVRPFYCADGKLTAAMQAQKLAKFVTGLPIPQPAWSGIATWGVSNAIPDVTTPRVCAYAGAEQFTFGPNSLGKAVWTSTMKSSGQSASVFTKHGKVQTSPDGSRTEYWSETISWKYLAK